MRLDSLVVAVAFLALSKLVDGAMQGGLESRGMSAENEMELLSRPISTPSRALLQSSMSMSPGMAQQIYSSPRAGSATSGITLQSLVPALRGAFSMVNQAPSPDSPPAGSPVSSIIVIDGTALVNGSSLGSLTADTALRLRSIQWNVLKKYVYDFQMMTVNHTDASTPAAPQAALRFRYVLRNALQSNANFQDLLGWAADLPSNFSTEAREVYGWNLSFVLQAGNIVRKINAASLPSLESATELPVPANVSIMAINVSIAGAGMIPFNTSHQNDLLTAYLQVLSSQGLLWADLGHISENAGPAYSSVLGSLSARKLLTASSAGLELQQQPQQQRHQDFMLGLHRQLLQASGAAPAAAATAPATSTGTQNVTVGMHLIFTADNSSANGSIAQAALSIAQGQQDVHDLLQAQGLAWELSLISLGVAVSLAPTKDVQLYSGRDVGAPSPMPSQHAAAPLMSTDRVTFAPAGSPAAAASHSGLSTSPVLGIVLGCAAALILATLLGCLLTYRKQLREVNASFKTWHRRVKDSKSRKRKPQQPQPQAGADPGTGNAKDAGDKAAVRPSRAQTRGGGINPEDTAALDTADFIMTTQDSASMASEPARGPRDAQAAGAGHLSPQVSSPSSDSMVLFPRKSIQVADPAERLQLVMQQSTEHERALQRWQAQEGERASSMAELSAFAQYRLKEGKLFKGHVMSGELSKSQEHVLCKAVRADQRSTDVTIKLFAFSAGLLSEQGACQEVSCGRVMPRALARCPEELDVDGGTTPACMLLEPVGRTLADRLSHMASEPLAPQEQVSMLAGLCAALQAFHARNLVLCNLQPDHFAWVPSKQPGWRLLNCSWWVRKGVAARPSYTLQFAAPELIAGDGQEVAGVIADPACDMWSLGVIAFHILSGRAFLPPKRFSNELVIAMGLGHLTYPFEARPDYFDDITPELQPLLASLLSRQPDKRPTITQVISSQPLAPIFADQAMATSAAFAPQAPFIPSKAPHRRHSPQKLSPRTQLRNQRLQAPRSLIHPLPPTGYPPIMSGYLAVAHENSVSESTSPSQTGTLKHPEESPAAEGGHVITTHAHGQMDSEQRSRSLLGGQEQSLPQNQHDARPLQLDNASAERHEINGEITRPRMDFSEITPAPLPPHQPTRQTASFVSPAGRSCLSDDAGSQSSMPAAVDVPAVPLRGVQKGRSILDSARDQHRDGDSHAWNDEAARSPTSSDPATRSDTAARLISTPQQPRMVPCKASPQDSSGKSCSSSAGADFQCMSRPQDHGAHAPYPPSSIPGNMADDSVQTDAGRNSASEGDLPSAGPVPGLARFHAGQTESTRYAAATSQAVLTSTPAPSMAMPAAVEHSAPASAASDASKARDSHQPDVLATLTPDELAALGMSQTIMEAAQPTFSASEPHEEPMQELSSRSSLIAVCDIPAPPQCMTSRSTHTDGTHRTVDVSFMTASSVMTLASACSYQPSSYATASSTMSRPHSSISSRQTCTGFGPGVRNDTGLNTHNLALRSQSAACVGPHANADLDVDDHDISTGSTAFSLALGHEQHEQEAAPVGHAWSMMTGYGGPFRSGAQELEDRECGMVHSAFDDTFDPRGVQLTLAGNLDSQDMDRDEGWSSADSSVYEAARDISCAASLADSELEQPPHGQGMSALEALQNAGLNMTT
ncbi:hypothetical protein WJX74_001973 [Apatococcus lobatus]|uniref:Protein kinase domain-containing protein n=1 Tax=Apatococcus lobatus TaxID=904363 RepID=A0AAW1RV38_9CHLO